MNAKRARSGSAVLLGPRCASWKPCYVVFCPKSCPCAVNVRQEILYVSFSYACPGHPHLLLPLLPLLLGVPDDAGAFSVIDLGMQRIGMVARNTAIATRALDVSRAGMGHLLPGKRALVRLPRTAGSGPVVVGAVWLQPRQLHHARYARYARGGQVVERRIVTSSFSSDDDREASSEAGKYSSSVDDVVGFGRVIRDPRKSKADVLRDSLASSANVPGNPKASAPGGASRTLEKTGKPVILSNSEMKTQDEWAQLDEHINEYPGERSFKAIGAGEADFVRSMRECVEKVVGGIEENQMDTKESSGGKYVSVTFRVVVQSAEEMKEIYELMKGDGRLKFFI